MAVGNGSTTAELESGLSSGGGAAETQQHHSQPLQQEEDIKDKDPETLIKMVRGPPEWGREGVMAWGGEEERGKWGDQESA